MANLLDLPYEVLSLILRESDPITWCLVGRTCRTLHDFIDKDHALYKHFYYQTWDESNSTRAFTNKDWKHKVQNYIRLDRILRSRDYDAKAQSFVFVADAILDLVESAYPGPESRNLALLRWYFDEDVTAYNRQTFLCNSQIYSRASQLRTENYCHPQIQALSAKLNVIHGKAGLNFGDASDTLMYQYACSRVYDFRNYTSKTEWGPYKADGSGSVDWEMMEAIMIILTYNLRLSRVFRHRLIEPVWDRSFSGVANQNMTIIEEYRSVPLRTLQQTLPDIYGIEGTWIRVICILDYAHLAVYNGVPQEDNHPRHPFMANEAIRMVAMQIKVTDIEAPGPDDGQELPIVHFYGTTQPKFAHSDPNAPAYANVRGYTKLTKEGEVRWTTFVVNKGVERYRSEGIQIGGLRSSRGVMGCWFDKDYNPMGPIGPTSFWKVSESTSAEAADVEREY